MDSPISREDAVIVGGGFYGAAIAIYLKRQRNFKRVTLFEREKSLLQRASYNNQARVHNGYHYPRSYTTAFRSRVNLPKFVKDWPEAVRTDYIKLYAIARRNSKVTARQFERFCREIGASIQPAESGLQALFEPRLIEEVFLVEEYAFDTTKLAEWARRELAESGVRVQTETTVTSISKGADDALLVAIRTADGGVESVMSNYVFNCTYAGLNQFAGSFPGTNTRLKHEIAEMALMEMPASLKGLGITVMDGSYFSTMPFPARGLHTLSHVRYTPHLQWLDDKNVNPYHRLSEYEKETRVDRMLRDAGRYLPAILQAKYVDSLFEVKTVLVKNETDDGRPILFEKHEQLPHCYSILGGKIDNVYDALEKLDAEEFKLNNRK